MNESTAPFRRSRSGPSVLFAHDGVFIAETEIVAVGTAAGQQTGQLVLIEIHLAQIGVAFLVIGVIGAQLAAAVGFFLLFHVLSLLYLIVYHAVRQMKTAGTAYSGPAGER